MPHKIKLLSQVAHTTFERGDYFFEQDKVQQLIANYLCTLPNVPAAPKTLQLNSEAVLKSILLPIAEIEKRIVKQAD